MREEEIDKAIRDAASQHHPPYDDKAWEKMELLLDKHLPQKKDRKKPLIFLLSFLLLGTAAFFTVKHFTNGSGQTTTTKSNKENNNNPTVAANKTAADNNKTEGTEEANNNTNTGTAANSDTVTGNNNVVTPATVTTGSTAGTSTIQPGSATLPVVITATYNNNSSKKSNYKKSELSNDNAGTAAIPGNNEKLYSSHKGNKYNQAGRTTMKIKKPGVGYDNDAANNKIADEVVAAGKTNTPELSNEIPATETDVADVTNVATEKNKTAATKQATDAAIEKTDSTKNIVADKKEADSAKDKTASSKKEEKKKKSFADKFAITLSAGEDVSYVEFTNKGKLKPIYGAGLTYAFGKHFAVSSGFYVSKKIYSALPEDYKIPGTNYPYLVGVDGDCKIYEIPVTVYYNFKQVKKHNWFGGAGLSTLLMKEEYYNYNYKYPGGQSYSYAHSASNENKHYFSVLTLSAGYKYKLNQRFSFMAEPYMKIPLAGVGVGKVKLKSAGVLVTAAIYPFAIKKK